MRRIASALMAGVLALGAAAPAFADPPRRYDRDWNDRRDRDWDRHDRREYRDDRRNYRDGYRDEYRERGKHGHLGGIPPPCIGAALDAPRPARDDDPSAFPEVRIGFMAEAAEHGYRGRVERRLKALPIGIVAESGRYAAVRVGDAIVARYDGVAMNPIGSDHDAIAARLPLPLPVGSLP